MAGHNLATATALVNFVRREIDHYIVTSRSTIASAIQDKHLDKAINMAKRHILRNELAVVSPDGHTEYKVLRQMCQSQITSTTSQVTRAR